jgi:prepilin-type N-terminal cleavage/methylation domain-containing protein
MKTAQQKQRKGFTLIELLVVIGIVVILSVVVVLTLNPAQLLRQARDSTRISDLSTIKSAISLYLADVTSVDLNGLGPDGPVSCSVHQSSTVSGLCTTLSRFVGAGNFWNTSTAALSPGSRGWIPVNFASTTGGSPIAALPIDPVNVSPNFYAYRPDNANLTFEINADMESAKYQSGGTSDIETQDGGNVVGLYEVGTDSGLDL